MLTRRKMMGLVAGIPLLGGLFGRRDVTSARRARRPLALQAVDLSWREVGDNYIPPDGIGTYMVTNDGAWKIRLGIAQWTGSKWWVTDGDIEENENGRHY